MTIVHKNARGKIQNGRTSGKIKRYSNLVGNNRRLVHVVVDRAGWRRGARAGAHMKPLRLLGRPLRGHPRREAQRFRPLRQTTHHLFRRL